MGASEGIDTDQIIQRDQKRIVGVSGEIDLVGFLLKLNFTGYCTDEPRRIFRHLNNLVK